MYVFSADLYPLVINWDRIFGIWLVLVFYSGEVWRRLHGLTSLLVCVATVPWTVSSADSLWALNCFVQQSRLVQGGGYVGLRLPRQADGLWEAVLEDSSGWMVLGSRDWLVVVLASLSKWVEIPGGSFEDSSGWIFLNTRDWLAVVTCPLQAIWGCQWL